MTTNQDCVLSATGLLVLRYVQTYLLDLMFYAFVTSCFNVYWKYISGSWVCIFNTRNSNLHSFCMCCSRVLIHTSTIWCVYLISGYYVLFLYLQLKLIGTKDNVLLMNTINFFHNVILTFFVWFLFSSYINLYLVSSQVMVSCSICFSFFSSVNNLEWLLHLVNL